MKGMVFPTVEVSLTCPDCGGSGHTEPDIAQAIRSALDESDDDHDLAAARVVALLLGG
jgi:hypothetical protein